MSVLGGFHNAVIGDSQHVEVKHKNKLSSVEADLSGNACTNKSVVGNSGQCGNKLMTNSLNQEKNACTTHPEHALANGDEKCGGVCAIIPLERREIISLAYSTSDFNSFDSTPVELLMLDDDGVLRTNSLWEQKHVEDVTVKLSDVSLEEYKEAHSNAVFPNKING